VKVYAQQRDFGRNIDLWFIEEGMGGDRVARFIEVDEHGNATIRMDEIGQAEVTPPSLVLPLAWVGPLVDALTEYRPSKLEESHLAHLTETLTSERARVDKMLHYLMRSTE
jgi:hypothetical protein